ncbi:LPXTG cell wall anchor domain-containing protein [Kocuria sp. NPDC057446]|uniref:LPXTG cell wall anchor domain-containing protein n=1 Tax=Kocuria sp. NPDC057446 TaxID=3346137 RepID=UPI0036CEDA4A
MTPARWWLVGAAGVVLIVSLVLALQGAMGSWLTSIGMVLVILSVFLGTKKQKKPAEGSAQVK